ncbi:MAG: enoyl-CoA hydratase/isomerase family protein [Polyangiaceae bacterium]|nr:enoyl-CoA hydratase/isomerase family protein [Polyangiaceae bacterium]
MSLVRIAKQGGLAELVLDRPKVNAMSRALLEELGAAFRTLAADDTVRGVLLRGEGSCFSAGLDLKELTGFDVAAASTFFELFDATFEAAFAFPKPLAAAVHGHAIAGGLVLALTADYIALRSGVELKVGLTELKVGVPFPRVAYEIVTHGLGGRAARAMRFSAELYPAEQAFGFGLGDAFVPDPVADARRWLDMVTARPAETFAFVKRQDRELALARVRGATLAERRALVAAILAAKAALTRVLA